MSSLPMALTLARFAAAPIVAALVLWADARTLSEGWAAAAVVYACAGGLFILAALTDFFDGWLARKYDAVTPLGAALDHAADKALVSAALAAAAYALFSPPLVFAAALILARDVAVAGLREGLSASGRSLPVNQFGKIKTVAEIAGVAAALLTPASALVSPYLIEWVAGAAFWLIWLAAALALFSGAIYARAAFKSA